MGSEQGPLGPNEGKYDARLGLATPAEQQSALDPSRSIPLAWLETGEGKTLPVESSCTIGRCASNCVVLLGEKVSRKHVLIHIQEGNEFWISDLGSSNGTYLNGRRLDQPRALFDRDQISIGPHRLAFRQPAGRHRPSRHQLSSEATICDSRHECGWLLLVGLESATHLAGSLPAGQITSVMASWHERSKEIIERSGGTLNKYLSDGFLAFWPDRRSDRPAMASALTELKESQLRSRAPFYFILHYGQVQWDGSPSREATDLSGPAVDFVLRARKLSASLRAPSLVSEVSQALLCSLLRFAEVGQHQLDGFAGEQVFYGI
jgi:pSer/pThr/pTyr-binding forkhead associated (FHA) protein